MIIDDEKDELPEITETYTDTWGKIVKVTILKEYYGQNGKSDNILTLTPDFENIENIDIVSTGTIESTKVTAYTEEFHLDGVTEPIKKLYEKIKKEITEHIPDLNFNPQRYYISLRKKRNFAFIQIRRKKILIVALQEENMIREKIKNYEIESLADGVQRFYNGPCARIVLAHDKHINEVINLLIEIQK
jgi:predicted transport protein